MSDKFNSLEEHQEKTHYYTRLHKGDDIEYIKKEHITNWGIGTFEFTNDQEYKEGSDWGFGGRASGMIKDRHYLNANVRVNEYYYPIFKNNQKYHVLFHRNEYNPDLKEIDYCSANDFTKYVKFYEQYMVFAPYFINQATTMMFFILLFVLFAAFPLKMLYGIILLLVTCYICEYFSFRDVFRDQIEFIQVAITLCGYKML